MIGLACFAIGIALGMAVTFVNVLFNYDGESSIGMVLWSFVIWAGLVLLFLFISAIVFGGVII